MIEILSANSPALTDLDYPDMVRCIQQDGATQCVVFDQTPDSKQKKIHIVVRPGYTIAKVIADIKTQYNYDKFDLILQPISGNDLVHLNGKDAQLLYDVSGFEPYAKNILILLPLGQWDGNVKGRYDIAVPSPRSLPLLTCDPIIAAALLKNPITTGNEMTAPLNGTITSNCSMSNCYSNNNNNNSPTSNGCIYNNGMNELNIDESICKTTNAITGYAVSYNHSSPPSSIATVMNPTNTDSLELSPISEPEQLSDDDLALGASASPVETELNQFNDSPVDFNSFSSELSKVRLRFDQRRIDFNKKYPLSPLPSVSSTTPSSSSHIHNNNSNNNNNDNSNNNNNNIQNINSNNITSINNNNINNNNNNNNNVVNISSSSSSCSYSNNTINNGYVGLVNQAMTCYLNSLLQALYMTPEFRNALYRWEFDNDHEAKNIPYQLQKLFLNLQTSKKSAVETTDLTRSFGWNSSEAWQQHDIQELCRVMFDALEHKFRYTKQTNLITNLYEGKMIDYVKCLECNTEKIREDTFLDIPLPVRPFGSSVAYGSIEEALRAFVQPETLDGNNQYFCEKCNKKCDAHKGLKFKNFPYILTLHLKRFDFDYQTMHRIKLNDKVTFPQILNLNTFVSSKAGHTPSQSNGASNVVTVDDCSTTDSGSAMEEDNWSNGLTTMINSANNEIDLNDEDQDEGIDISSSTDNRGNRDNNSIQQQSGPYVYELFAIMIHSGSASGGHYYAYIKEFDNGQWYCFNDQCVNTITNEDIQKSFGDGSNKAYFSSVYASSTNAYMLMYRRIDSKVNERALKVHEFPDHIKLLAARLKEEEEMFSERGGNMDITARSRPIADLALQEQRKPRVYFYNPRMKKLNMVRVYISMKFDVKTILESAYQTLNIEQFAPITHCRLVAYDPPSENIIRSFENIEEMPLLELTEYTEDPFEFLIETRTDDQEFEIYEPGGTTWYVYTVNLCTMEMDGPFYIYSQAFDNNDILKRSIAVRLNLKEENIIVATTKSYKKAFVAYDKMPTNDVQQCLQQMVRTQFKDVIHFFLNVPSTDPANLELMDIQIANVENHDQLTPIADAILNPHDESLPPYTPTPIGHNETSSIPVVAMPDAVTISPDLKKNFKSSSTRTDFVSTNMINNESNSEDSSLSDGDRTLVENVQNRGSGGGNSQLSSNSHSPQISSPEDDKHQCPKPLEAIYNALFGFYKNDKETDLNCSSMPPPKPPLLYFYAVKLDTVDTATAINNRQTVEDADTYLDELPRKPVVSYKIYVNFHMKMAMFEAYIARLINVPEDYFQIYRKLEKNVNMLLSLTYFNEGDVYGIELGRPLLKDEHRAKIYFMRLSELNNDTDRLLRVCDWIYTDETKVSVAKKKLIAKLQRIDPIKYQTINEANCRLWMKGGHSLVKIYRDDEKLGSDLRSTVTVEFLVQECENVAPQPDEKSLTIFVRRWHPDTFELDKFEEITLHGDDEIRQVLSSLSGIPMERIAYTKVNESFPNMGISLLSLNSSLSWYATPSTLHQYPLSSANTGNLFFYKDAMIAPKELTREERRAINVKEKIRLDRYSWTSSNSGYSTRRERALKIYLDSPTTTTATAAPTSMTPPSLDGDNTMIDHFS